MERCSKPLVNSDTRGCCWTFLNVHRVYVGVFLCKRHQGMSAGYWDSLERHDSFIKLCRDILPEYLTDDEDQYNCDDFPYDTMARV